jgi:hypothetical protein
VYYIRDQADFIESYYLQTIHEGGWKSFDGYLKSLGRHGFSWLPVYESLCVAFGAENVVLKSFEHDISQGQPAFLRSFLQSAIDENLNHFGDFEYRAARNPSIGDRGLELARGINPLLKTTMERKIFRRFMQENFSNRMYPRPVLFLDAALLQNSLMRRDSPFPC